MRSAAALLFAFLLLSAATDVAGAQEAVPTPTPPPPSPQEGPKLDLGGLAGDVAEAIWNGLQERATAWLTQPRTPGALLTGARQNILTHLEPTQTTQAPAVMFGYAQSRLAADALLSVVVTALGFACLTRWGGLTGKEVLWLVGPRLVIAVLAVNVGRDALDWLARAVNALCDVLTAGTLTDVLSAFVGSGANWGAVLLVAAVELATLALLTSRVFIHALFSILVVVTPLVWVAWVFPAWGGALIRWGGLLAALLLGQVVQVLALAQGANLAASLMANQATDPLLAAASMLATLCLATVAPSLVGAGVVTGGFGVGRLLWATRRLSRLTPAGAVAGAAWDAARGGGSAWVHPANAVALPTPKVVDVTWRPVLPQPRLALASPR